MPILPPCPPYGTFGPNPCSSVPQLNEIDLSTNINATPNVCTFCTGDTTDNIWFIPGAPGYPGQCRLDQLTFEQVHDVLQRVPQAKKDLLRITTDPVLVQLANETRLTNDDIEADQKSVNLINRGVAGLNPGTNRTIPFYTVFRGNFGGDIGGTGGK